MTKLTSLEVDLLRHLVTGCETHADGRPLAWGAWMTACLESLCSAGYAKAETDPDSGRHGYFATDLGGTALSLPPHTPETLDECAALIAKEFPGWWWTFGLCYLSGDCSIGPDYNDPKHRDRLISSFPMEKFDAGFHCDLQPGGGIEAIRLAVMECVIQARAAIAEHEKEMGK